MGEVIRMFPEDEGQPSEVAGQDGAVSDLDERRFLYDHIVRARRMLARSNHDMVFRHDAVEFTPDEIERWEPHREHERHHWVKIAGKGAIVLSAGAVIALAVNSKIRKKS